MDRERDMELFEHYIEIGAIEVDSITEDAEFLYRVTDKAKDVAPELWEMHTKMIEETMLDLVKKDLVSVEYDENLKAMISISDQGLEALRESGFDV